MRLRRRSNGLEKIQSVQRLPGPARKAGGASKTGGAIFQVISPSNPQHVWSLQMLAQFITKPAGGGSFPVGTMVPDGNGNAFGMTEAGGTGGVGTVFEITP